MAQLRLACATQATTIHGELGILSLSSSLSADGCHLHIAVAASQDAAIGRHLCTGSLVSTSSTMG